ncbi:lysophospholipase L1-like esterase [Spirosoma oryzae]|uniref:Lysophospholipase L1-like esterase n=1 Tax=Spirosoma oryzae TaxID=1469603 RepID=A0A2T0SC89_9BACT|nr:GDSL-type esterase/lipase family protein [Spirosoma oryzae]PRY31040.1 lysophospholipase L1-like esterase [Spirosoma oryzae]
MNWYEDEVGQLDKKLRNSSPNSVIFYGSSTVRLWTGLEQDFPDVKPINAGFGGSTLAACAWFFERLIVPARPRTLVLYAGDNDLGDNRHPEEVYLSFCALAAKIQRDLPDTDVTFVSIKPSPSRWHIVEQIRAANRYIENEIKRLPRFSFVDLTQVMLTPDGKPRKELYQADGLHMNADGYALWCRELTARVPDLTQPTEVDNFIKS